MYLPQPRPRPGIEENILPMINIVFLLLIFFMIAGAIYQQDAFPVDPPGTQHAPETSPGKRVVAIAADGRISLDGRAVTVDELLTGLREARAGTDRPPVRIKADTDLPARELTALLARLRGIGIAEVRLLTVDEGG